MEAAQRTENNHKWTSDLRVCYKSKGGATEKVVRNPLVIAQAFLPSVPRFKSHWKVRNKTAFSTAMTMCLVAKSRVIFVIAVKDIALTYLHYHGQDLRLHYVHTLVQIQSVCYDSWARISQYTVQVYASPSWCIFSHCLYSAEYKHIRGSTLPSLPPSLWGWEAAQPMEAAKGGEQPHAPDAMSK